VNLDMLATAKEKFAQDPAVEGKPILQLTEITMRNLLAERTDVDRRDFLARAELLAACGETVLITDYFDYYRLAAYIAERTSERIGIVMGVPSLIDLFDERNHAQLPGGILESFGRLFKNGLKLYVYPLCPGPDEELKTVDDIKVQSDLQPLYDYLAGRGSFVNLDNYRPEYLPIFSRDVLRRIASNDDSWETMVPEEVAQLIKRRGFFGYVRPDARDLTGGNASRRRSSIFKMAATLTDSVIEPVSTRSTACSKGSQLSATCSAGSGAAAPARRPVARNM
jgi:hypothetical protein